MVLSTTAKKCDSDLAVKGTVFAGRLPTPATSDQDPIWALSQQLPAKEGSVRAPLFRF